MGYNKKNQVVRLIYEISLKEKIDPINLAESFTDQKNFKGLKKNLIERRYPKVPYQEALSKAYLPVLSKTKNPARLDGALFSPNKIYYEPGTENSKVLKNTAREYPSAEFIQINSLKEFTQEASEEFFDYNSRRDRIFITKESHDFFKRCPCTSGCLNCNYYILNAGFGCPYECEYCFLQGYSNAPGIILHSNTEDFLGKIPKGQLRAGTGEFMDSLILDNLTEDAGLISAFIKENRRNMFFEFKTKSVNIEGLLENAPADNIVVAWSLNPEKIISRHEHYTTSLSERLDAALESVKSGLRVAFHFDPIILYENWEEDYLEMASLMLSRIPHDAIVWISVGSFRFQRKLKPVIETRFPSSELLHGNLLLGFDGKLRYLQEERAAAYKKLCDYIKKEAPGISLYLCMEDPETWRASGLESSFSWDYASLG